ncbi:MAG: cyclic nucleotide-binding domain-containing protein [Acidimicrobiia bacterium]
MRQDARIKLLGDVWLFERCSRKELALIASQATPMQIPAGKELAREGEFGREFFVVIAGKVEAVRNGVTIGILGPGSFFGEMALLERQPRVATVVAVEPTEVLVLTTQGFASVVDQMPSVDRKMLTVLATRLRELEDRFVPAGERLLSPP